MIAGAFLLIFLVLYVVAIRVITRAWLNIPVMPQTDNQRPVSVLVVYRNEESSLPDLLQSLQKQKVSPNNFEFIFVNDHSSDNSVKCIEDWIPQCSFEAKNIHLIDEEYGKKTGIEKGVEAARYDLILMCDADCIMGPLWVESMTNHGSSDFVSGPVAFKSKRSVWNAFLQLDFMSLIVLGAALIQRKTPVLANGANMMFSKSIFIEIEGYTSNKKLASGDDIFLLDEIAQRSNRISFVKNQEAIVRTNAPENLKEFVHQRIRWAKKTKHSTRTIQNGIIQVLTVFYLAYIIAIPLAYMLKSTFSWFVILFVVIAKTCTDAWFFSKVVPFFNRKPLLQYLVFIQLLHPIYIATIAVFGVFRSYTWKERVIKNG
ncbi:MAG: biofilm PGA synthesis N-glycosyltransferase PgaC [Bacteroidia bacterium]|jgi:biofilm PGA synthesis N-glycosyltransferase PgaC